MQRIVNKNVLEVELDSVWNAYRQSSIVQNNTIFLDWRYRSLTLEVWETLLRYIGIDRNSYLSDDFHCDYFAKYIRAIAVNDFGVNGAGIIYEPFNRKSHLVLLAHKLSQDGKLELSFSVVGARQDEYIIGAAEELYAGQNGTAIFD